MTLLPLTALLLSLNPPDGGETLHHGCPSAGGPQDFPRRVLGPSLAKELPPPGTEAKRFLAANDSWIRDCPHNETVWYTVLRAAELTSQDRKAPADLVEAARTAVPNSVWIETVRARALGTVQAAETAIRLDPKHVPAQVALATADERTGDHESALRILRSIRDLHRVVGGPLLLARVALALGDAKLAAESAHREPDREGGLIEPVSGMLLVGEARLLEGDVRLKLGQAGKALTAFYEAQFWGSFEARERLHSPTVTLERAMEARLKESHLDEELRCSILEDLGGYRLRSGNVKGGVGLLLKALLLPEDPGGFEDLEAGGPEVRKELERRLARPHVPARERERIEEVLKRQSPRTLAEPER